MSEPITNFGPLNDPSMMQAAQKRSAEHKKKKAAAPPKFRAQEGTMRVSKKIADGSVSLAGAMVLPESPSIGHGLGLIIAIPIAIAGGIARSVQRIAESLFGKPIDLYKNKYEELSMVATLSKTRIEKNFKRGFIDEPTKEILNLVKSAAKEMRPWVKELKSLEVKNQTLDTKLKRSELITAKKKEYWESVKNDPSKLLPQFKEFEQDINKRITQAENEFIRSDKIRNELKEKIEKNNNRIKEIKLNINTIKTTPEAKHFFELRQQNVDDLEQRKQDKSLLSLGNKLLDKKYKKEDGTIDVKKFFDDKYATYYKSTLKHKDKAVNQDKFIKNYYYTAYKRKCYQLDLEPIKEEEFHKMNFPVPG